MNPTDVDTLGDPPHDDQHANANDAVEAVETELGINPRGSHADVRARLDATDAGNLPVARARVASGNGNITETEAVEATAVLAIPASWNTYDVDAWCSAQVRESGTLTTTQSVAARLKLDGLAGTLMGLASAAVGTAAPHNTAKLDVDGFAEGETTTGSRSVVVTMDLSGDTGQVDYDFLSLTVYAWRIT